MSKCWFAWFNFKALNMKDINILCDEYRDPWNLPRGTFHCYVSTIAQRAALYIVCGIYSHDMKIIYHKYIKYTCTQLYVTIHYQEVTDRLHFFKAETRSGQKIFLIYYVIYIATYIAPDPATDHSLTCFVI
jgi:hypothetical protein